MDEFVLTAKARSEFGSRSARRLRQQGLLPANVYGHQQANLALCLDRKEFERFFEAGHRLVVLEVAGKQEHGVVKEVQYDGMGSEMLHVDFARVDRDEKIELEVHLNIVGVPKGVASGGVLDVPHKEVTVSGPANRLPESIELNVSELKIGDAIRFKDLPVPAGCSFVGDAEEAVVIVHAPKGEEGAPETAAPTEPQVIRKEKDDEESAS